MIRLTIIIATYNSSKTIYHCLNSICNQHLQDWECIIVDGGSTDNTINIVQSFQKNDSRINYVSEKDKGIYDAFNKGLKLAQGYWIYYLGSDDLLLPNSMSEIMGKELTEVDIVYGNISIKFPNHTSITVTPYNPSMLRYHMFSNHQAIIMKRSIIEKMDGFNIDYRMASDFDLMQRCYLAKYKFKYVPVTIAQFSYSGLSSQFSMKQDLDILHINRKNSSNKFPLLFFSLYELKRFLGYLKKKYIDKCI